MESIQIVKSRFSFITYPLLFCCLSFPSLSLFAQSTSSLELNHSISNENSTILTLNDCLKFALKNQPTLNQSLIDQSIANINKKIATSSWFPQISGSANYQNYLQLPTAFSTVNGNLTAIKSGVFNYSIPQFTATQSIFSTDLIFASKIAGLNKEASIQSTTETKINLVSTVSKAFYDLLLSIEQIGVYREDTARLIKNQRDAYHRYVSGIVDKVDYKQSTISLNNALSRLK